MVGKKEMHGCLCGVWVGVIREEIIMERRGEIEGFVEERARERKLTLHTHGQV